MRSFRLIFSLLFLLTISHKHYAQSVCSQAQPVCAGTQNIFPGETTGLPEVGPDYGCLQTQLNPSWHTLEIASSGFISISMSGSIGADIDYICYGPFTSVSGNCGNLSAGNIVGCSYSNSSVETLTLNAIAGQFYVLMVANFSGSVQSVIVAQSGGTGSLDCSDVCDITSITRTVSTCSGSTYSVNGNVSVNGVPTVGTLTITNSCGGTPVVYSAPFPTPITYSFTNLTADGSPCTITANFSALTTCSLFTNYTAPTVPVVAIAASSNPLCLPGSETLTASGAATYTWSTGSTSNPLVTSPVVSTNYSVTGTSAGGCTNTAAISVTVANTPTVSAFVIPFSVCANSSATLIATGALTYVWQPGGFTTNTVAIAPSVSTTYTVTGTLGPCSNTATAFVNVVNGPTLSVSSTSAIICAGNSATLSASGAVSYTWFPGGTISPSIVVSPGTTTTYTVVGVNFSGCTTTNTIVQPVSPLPNIVISPSSPSVCTGSSINLSATGATSYTWNPGNLTGNTINVSPATNTTYTVVGSNGTCTNSALTTVTVVPLPIVGASSSSPTVCAGNAVTLSGTGANSYVWNPGSLSGANVVVTPAVTTNYTVTGTLNGCTNTAVASVTVLNGPTVNASATPTSVCPGGTATLTASGAVAYTWSPGGATTPAIIVNPLTTSIFSVTGANASGCRTSTTVIIVVNSAPTILASATSNSVCIGNNTTLNASGAVTYTWNPGNLTGASVVVSPVINTTYTVTGTNASGCTGQTTLPITVVPLPTIGATSTPTAICRGNSATLNATGATNYTWNPGNLNGSSVIVTPSVTTVYNVIGENNGCTASTQVTVVVNSNPLIGVVALPTNVCPGGTSTLSASGGVSYLWSTGATTSSISVNPLTTTAYTVTGTNAQGCSTIRTVTVTVNPAPTINVSASSSTICAGASTTLSATGAVSYTWMPGNLNGANVIVTPSITTVYTVSGASSFGCAGQNTIQIIVVPIPVLGAVSNPTAICAGNTANLNAGGATSYTWNPGNLNGNSVIVSPLATTVYTVLGSTSGCTASAQVTLVVNNGPAITVTASPASICAGSSSTLSASGALNYTWTPGNLNGSSIVVTPPVTTVYSVIGENAAGCVSTRTLIVTVNAAPTIFASSSSASVCQGSSATLNASGANTYTWNPGNLNGASVVVTPLTFTSYTVTGTAAGGCTSQAIVDVGVNPIPVVGATSFPASICSGGSANLTGTGATSYTWNPGNLIGTNVTVTPSVTTVYNVIGESNGCTATAQVTVIVNNNPSLSLSASPATICPGNPSTLTASGASSYTWNPGNLNGASVIVSPAVTTIYNVTGSNGVGCTATGTIEVTVSGPPSVNISAVTDSVCAGGSTTLTATGANAYVWNPGNLSGQTVIVSPASNTTYTVTGTNGAGCSGENTILITVVPIPVLGAVSNPTAICSGNTANLNVGGATTYTWNPGNLSGNSVVVSPLATTVYTALGSTGGCTASIQVTLVVNNSTFSNPTADPALICPGNSSTLTASGLVNYTWTPGNISGATVIVTPFSTTIYTVTGENTFGCTSAETVQVTVDTAPSVTAAASSTNICEGNSVTLSAFGSAVSYTWNPGNLTGQSITVSPATTTGYTVVGATGAGCSGVDVITIVVNPVPTVTATASPATICSGSTATLTGSGATSYTWFPLNLTGPSVTVAPTVSTTYTLIGENGGCADIALVTVTVNTVPTVNINATSTSLCSGTTATLTASGTLSYNWLNTGETTPEIVVSPAVTTVYTVTGSNGAGCSASATFTLNVGTASNLTLTANPPQVCQGFTTTVTAMGGTSYTWAAGIGTGSTILSSPMVTTTYTVFSDNGICTSSAAITVTVNPLPNPIPGISSPVICSGQTVMLSASGAVNYTWMPSNLIGATVTDTPAATTEYTLIGASAIGCTNSAVVTVTVLSTPQVILTANPPAVCIGNSATLTASGATAYTLEPGTLIGTSFTVTPTANTTYTLYGDNGGCANGMAVLEVTVNPLPVITAASSAPVICGGSVVTLTASGAQTYSWLPNNATGDIVSDNPLVSTIYTVSGMDANGCSAETTVSVDVTPQPTLLINATSVLLCQGDGVTLTASGAVNYTWNPGNVLNAVITDTPTTTTTYTVEGQDAIGCVGSETILITVVNVPTITVAPLHTPVCEGSPVTFTATGATNYTWLPSGNMTDINTETPLVTTNYTVIGDNGGGCISTFTFDVFVNPLPTGLSATASGSITCATPNVDLFGSSTSTAVSYSWTGPQSFTSALQNPTGVNVWGVFTLNVSDNNTGCTASTTVEVLTDGSIPLVTATTSGSITCSAPFVTLNAVHTTTNPAYSWIGPNNFTSTAQSFTTSTPGIYSVTVTDLTSSCKDFDGIVVGTHTNVTITASISAATCSNSSGNNDGTIQLFNFGVLDKFDLVSGLTYTGAATYTNANIISADGIITNNLANPTSTLAFTIRLFDAEGCVKDTTLILQPTDCVPRTLGLAKNVSAPVTNADGTYNITYTVIVKNYDSNALSNVALTENLSQTFPSPTTFTVSTPLIIDSLTTGLVKNLTFDGVTQTNLVDASTSSLAIGQSDTITFNVIVNPNGFFGPFNNWVTGEALNTASVTVRDSSTTGMEPNFPNAGNPNSNSFPTVINFTPVNFFGITKTGAMSARLTDGSYDITYNVTVHNLGNDTLLNIEVKDSLFESTIRNPAKYTIKSAPSSNGSIAANAAFNGNSDINLVAPFSKLAPRSSNIISFVINVNLDTVTIIKNSAFGECLTRNNFALADTSNAGDDPDSNHNGVWNEPSDNMPTVLTITNYSLFIPQGFSPDGDAINQFFVIKGLPVGENSLTVFNRWGNKVYYKGNYDNTWEGYPNVSGILGSDKLPQGTYYYVLDMKGSGFKPITGFIVLQY